MAESSIDITEEPSKDTAIPSKSTGIYDLLILVDATYSMSNYLASLQTSLPKIISISDLTDSFSRIGLLAYRDYSDDNLLEWSGWMHQDMSLDDEGVDLLRTAANLRPNGGGDYPEATKTGLARAYDLMREDATTITLLYTDAPPHTAANGDAGGYAYGNYGPEQTALEVPGSYGGFGPAFMDWVSGCRMLAMKNGFSHKRAQVFSILEPSMSRSDGSYYTFLSTMTDGGCFYLKKSDPETISKVTIDILVAWMGVEKAGAATTEIAASLSKFKNPRGIAEVRKEASKAKSKDTKGKDNTEELSVNSVVLKNFLPKRNPPVQDFAERYKQDDCYKKLAVNHISRIITDDVSAISLNPVFGSLWRAVCNDRENPDREGLISSFGLQVDRIGNADEKARMKAWLAESYDYTAEVQETVDKVPESLKFPCVYLDPTITFSKASDPVAEEDDRPITDFRRDELLEICRSCDWRILMRLGRVLTRLTFADNPDQLPAHIASADTEKVTRIPLALASKELGRKFWRILLHIIVPGTMLSARPAALLAALSIHLGIDPLFEAASTEMLLWRDKWNNLEVPETWNVSCLSLLSDANNAYLQHKKISVPQIDHRGVKGLLKESDRNLFGRLASYKMLELNLKTTLTAKVGWKPDKTTIPIGPVVVCRACNYPRSVTIMSKGGKCGNCVVTDYPSPEQRQKWIDSRVSKADDETTNATWVECGTKTCRAQYVVYHPEALNVRPRCFYCRMQSSVAEGKRNDNPAPFIECKNCLSKVIFPHEYRPQDVSHYKCVACYHKRKTIVDVQTTAEELSKDQGTAWLLKNKNDKLKQPLSGRSLLQQITQAGTTDFCENVLLFPNEDKQKLYLNGKLIRNTPELIFELKSWVDRRRTETGTCSLCFADFRKSDLNPACGRHGCNQRICRSCLNNWYGLNAAGRIINTAALSCPFCRRAPAAKTLHAYGMGIHAVANLREAVEKRGEWVYAWCTDCATAKQYLERICARGAPPDPGEFTCEVCQQAQIEEARRMVELLEAEQARQIAEAQRLRYERGVEREEAEAAAAQLAKWRMVKDRAGKRVLLKHCPKCTVLTEKTIGCGHMQCACGEHWCWFCGQRSSPEAVYGHMTSKHGSWYGS